MVVPRIENIRSFGHIFVSHSIIFRHVQLYIDDLFSLLEYNGIMALLLSS